MDSNLKQQILLIGAGQLGSRHLQGLLKRKVSQIIYVVDPSLVSLETAKIRADEITHEHKVHYKVSWENLPVFFDLVIVATNSNVREKVVEKLMNEYHVNNLILEKVLFQKLDSFNKISLLLNQSNTKTWVNHPRRLFKSYCDFKLLLNPQTPKVYQVTGGNWGLGCNGLHFIDLILFLSESKIGSLDSEWIDDEILESKRIGFVEFTGTIKGQLENCSTFFISSLKDESSAITITIFDSKTRYIIQEGGTPQILILKDDSNFKPSIIPFSIEFQSNLTTQLVDDIFHNGDCNLPTFNEACDAHKPFIKCLLNTYNTLKGIENNILPIT